MAEVTLSMEEYLRLLEEAGHIVPFSGSGSAARRQLEAAKKSGVVKRKGTALKGMASALKKANAKARKKNGDFKKGWTQARVMKEAHRLRRKK